MEGPETLPLHDVYYLTADDTTALEPSAELIARFHPALMPFAEGYTDINPFLAPGNCTRQSGGSITPPGTISTNLC